MKRILYILAAALYTHHAVAEATWQSSFAGLDFDINGIRLDLPIEQSLKQFDPQFRLRMTQWADSQGVAVRSQPSGQNYATGAIWSIREQASIVPTPWHAGSLIRSVHRHLSIKPDDQKPTISDYRAAVIAKYGEPTVENRDAISRRRTNQMVYAVKDGRIADVPCFSVEIVLHNIRDNDSVRVAKYERMLDQIDSAGYCDAVMVNYYTVDARNQERINYYGAFARDFRLEAESFIADVRKKADATRERQAHTPAGKPNL